MTSLLAISISRESPFKFYIVSCYLRIVMAVIIIFTYVKLIQRVLFIWLYKKCAILPWSSINQISSIFPHSYSFILSLNKHLYSMHPLAWSKHCLCPPSWLRFECSSVAWESTTTLQLFGLDILIWLHNIITPPRKIIFPWYVYTVSFWFLLFGVVQVTYILKW